MAAVKLQGGNCEYQPQEQIPGRGGCCRSAVSLVLHKEHLAAIASISSSSSSSHATSASSHDENAGIETRVFYGKHNIKWRVWHLYHCSPFPHPQQTSLMNYKPAHTELKPGFRTLFRKHYQSIGDGPWDEVYLLCLHYTEKSSAKELEDRSKLREKAYWRQLGRCRQLAGRSSAHGDHRAGAQLMSVDDSFFHSTNI